MHKLAVDVDLEEVVLVAGRPTVINEKFAEMDPKNKEEKIRLRGLDYFSNSVIEDTFHLNQEVIKPAIECVEYKVISITSSGIVARRSHHPWPRPAGYNAEATLAWPLDDDLVAKLKAHEHDKYHSLLVHVFTWGEEKRIGTVFVLKPTAAMQIVLEDFVNG